MRYIKLFIVLLIHGQLLGQATDEMTVNVFVSGENGYEHYRIPALLSTSKGTLLAFCEARKETGDAGDIDMVLKRSSDGGKTWSPSLTIWDDGKNTCGNPCPVIDEKTGTIWLLMTHNLGEDKENAIIKKESKGTRTVWVTSSNDDGLTWTTPVEITKTTKDPAWGWYATGPGVGIQVKHGKYKGRLVIPADHSYDDPNGKVRGGPYEYGSHVIYSDDHGKSWKSGGTIRPKVNECQVVEVADGKGTLLMNMRSYYERNRRTHSWSYDGGATWTAPADAEQLLDPVCQASILRYSWPKGKSKSVMLFLNPASGANRARRNMSLRASFDEGKTWPVLKTLHEGPSAYSSVVVLPDGNIGCFYEAGEVGPYERIIFHKVDKRILTTGGKSGSN